VPVFDPLATAGLALSAVSTTFTAMAYFRDRRPHQRTRGGTTYEQSPGPGDRTTQAPAPASAPAPARARSLPIPILPAFTVAITLVTIIYIWVNWPVF
jgi:hypothetical protein